jgi:YVTN family beta-propeller protein
MHYMKDTRGCLLLSVTYLVCLLGMALVAITAQGQAFVYVANAHSDSVSVIDTASAVGSVPFGVAITPDGTRAYVTNSGESTVSVIDTASNTVVDTGKGWVWPLWSGDDPGNWSSNQQKSVHEGRLASLHDSAEIQEPR